jgi:cold shock CspA family protein
LSDIKTNGGGMIGRVVSVGKDFAFLNHGEGNDVFVHKFDFEKSGFKFPPQLGARYEYELWQSPRGPCARNLRWII